MFIPLAEPRKLTNEDMIRMNVGKRYWHVSLDSIPEECDYKKKLWRFIKSLSSAISQGKGFLFCGDYRQGKTSASVILCKAVVSSGGTAYFIRSDELTKVVVESHWFDEDKTVLDRMREVDLLVIDDVGTEASKEYGESLVENLIRYRYDNLKSMVVTTNVGMPDLVSKYGQGVMKVMASMMVPVEVSGTHWYEEEVEKMKELFDEQEDMSSD